MKLIKRDTDYAVRAVSYMASSEDRLVSVAEMVKTLKIPRPFLRKILQKLNKAGLLASYKGIGGGFKLVRPAKKILITDLIQIFQGRLRLNECFFKKKLCPNRATCALKKKIDSIEKKVFDELKGVSIGSLINNEG